MKIVALQQRSPEWLTWRHNGIGGSDAAAILGQSIFTTPQELWEIKRGLREPPPVNVYMQRGIDYEDEAREYFASHIGEDLAPLCGEHDEASFIRASFDGCDITGSMALEIKVPGAKAHAMALSGHVPPYYMPQLQHQMLVASLPYIYYGSYQPESKSGVLLKVERDNRMIDELWEAEHRFWQHVQEGVPMYTAEWAEAAAAWLAADVDYQAAAEAKKAAQARLEALHPPGMDSFKAAGVTASRWTKTEGTDWQAFASDHGLTMNQIDSFRPPSLGPVDEERLLSHLNLAATCLEKYRIRSRPIYTVKRAKT